MIRNKNKNIEHSNTNQAIEDKWIENINIEEIFEFLNKNKTWQINGDAIEYKNLNEETKSYLQKFAIIHLELQNSTDNVDFGDLIVKLGNKYANIREELTQNYKEDENTKKLSTLEKAFNMYNETKVIGNVSEIGSIANVGFFDLEIAKSERMMQEKRIAFQSGENTSDIKARDITLNDDRSVEDLITNAKNTLSNVAEFFNKNGVINSTEEQKKLYSYVGSNEESWSLDKLITTFRILEKVEDSNPEKYSEEEFNALKESKEFKNMFKENEQQFFEEMYNIYKKQSLFI